MKKLSYFLIFILFFSFWIFSCTLPNVYAGTISSISIRVNATLLDWKSFNEKVKTLVAGSKQDVNSYENKIKTIAESKTMPWSSVVKVNLSTSDDRPIRAWFEEDTLYYYSSGSRISLNEDSTSMFDNFTKLSNISALANWDTSSVKIMDDMFAWCTDLEELSALKNWDTSNVTSMNSMFVWDQNIKDISWLANWNTSKLLSMSNVFHNCHNLSDISALEKRDVSNVNNMSDLFYDTNLNDISPLKNWNIKNVKNISWMFAWTNIKDVNALKNWNTSNIEDMGATFQSCSNLSDISALANWDTSSLTDIGDIFYWPNKLEDISALKNWNTSKVTDMVQSFRWCKSLKDATPLANWDTHNVRSMEFLFEWCENLEVVDLTNWNTSKVESIFQMFHGCKNLKTIYASKDFTTENVVSGERWIRDPSTEVFDWATALQWWNGTKYDASHTDKTYARLDTASQPWYFTLRSESISSKNNEQQSSNKKTQNESSTNMSSTSQTQNNAYSKEMNEAYSFAYKNWITTAKNIESADMNAPLKRIAMAKMLSNYATQVLHKVPDSSKGSVTFDDVSVQQNNNYGNAVTLAYQLWIMWQWTKHFRPNDTVTRAEFATALSRLLYSTSDGNPYYETHLKKLKNEWIITKDNPSQPEVRWYVMLMLYRSAQK